MYKMTSKATMTIKYQQPQPTSSVVDRYRYIVLVQWMHKSLMTMNGLPAIRYWWMFEWTDKADGLTYGRYVRPTWRMDQKNEQTAQNNNSNNKTDKQKQICDLCRWSSISGKNDTETSVLNWSKLPSQRSGIQMRKCIINSGGNIMHVHMRTTSLNKAKPKEEEEDVKMSWACRM